MGYIYRIQNIVSGKSYIGETKKDDVETRWKGHIQAISRGEGCPALRDAIKKYGLDKFKFTVLIICFDEDRFTYEREYIKKYNSVVPNGYNITSGGEGGGFVGRKHTAETIEKIKKSAREFHENNPEHRNIMSTKIKHAMSNVNMREVIMNSDKFRKAVEEGRVGGKFKEDTKQKISDSLKEYYKNNDGINKRNIEKHRISMAKAVGFSINQYDLHNNFICNYISIAEASRVTGICKSAIRLIIKKGGGVSKGFIWKRATDKHIST
jgi:group I intron endonuclease